MDSFFDRESAPRMGETVLIGLGIWIRLKVYWAGRSLFLDEANLSRNIVERSWSGFFQTLDYQQYAPPGYLVLVKSATAIFGTGEYGLRLVALMSSIALLLVVRWLSHQLIRHAWPRLIPIFLVAFSYEMIRYGTENKQYAWDAWLAALLIALALRYPPEKITRRGMLAWACGGALAVWCTMPVVFILSGIGLYYAYGFWRTARPAMDWLIWLASVGWWLISFGLYYFWLLRPDIASDYLNTYHQAYFLPLLPQNIGDWQQLGRLLWIVMAAGVGHFVIAVLVGYVSLLWGCRVQAHRSKSQLLLLGIPVFSCLLASGFEQYSLLPRLILFLIPLLVLLMGIGTDAWWARHRRSRRWLFWLWLVILPMNGGLLYLVMPFSVEDTREVLRAAQQAAAGELVYVHHEAVPAAVYYRDYHPDRLAFRQKPYYLSHWDETPDTLREQNLRDFWYVYSHLVNDHTRNEVRQQEQALQQWARKEEEVAATAARAQRWVITAKKAGP